MVDWRHGWNLLFRREAREALRNEVRHDVMQDVYRSLSLDWKTTDGVPNLTQINAVIRNSQLANLNLKFFGYELAKALAANVPAHADTEERRVDLPCKGSIQADMESDWLAHWCSQLKVPIIMHRKLWELAYILQAICEHGHMREGARGLGFGCGTEPIPSYLASRGASITVTDLPAERAQEAGWADTGQHAATLESSFRSEFLDRDTFDRRVSLEIVDMNAIPSHLRNYDFCWSVCALEHLGSIEQGLAFIENSLETLRPGGLSVHTTELNIDPDGPTFDNWPTVLFQPKHIEALADRLREKGHEVAPLDFALGDKPMDRFIDLPPWPHDLSTTLHQWSADAPHLKVAVDGFVSTCFGIIVRKAA